MKELLGVQKDEDLTENSYGKPALQKGNNYFNLSHSGDYVVLAVDLFPLGVDIEAIESADLAVAKKCFQENELAYLNSGIGNFDEKFFSLWTLKESLMKETGMGFQLPPESFHVMDWDQDDFWHDKKRWYFKQYRPNENYIISVCASGEEFSPDYKETIFDLW